MSLALALALLAAPAALPPPPPPGLVFGFYRLVVFQKRAKQLRCGANELDHEFEVIRKKLVQRYGKKAFAPPEVPTGGFGDCGAAISVYRVNLADFRKEAEAALATSAE